MMKMTYMEQFPQFDNDFLGTVGSTMRQLRNSHGYSIEDLIKILNNKFGVDISSNLMSKIENNNSKIQIDHYLALAYFYKMENGEIFSYPKPDSDLAEEIATISKKNPDLRYILECILKHSDNFLFMTHIKSVVKSAINLFQNQKSQSEKTVLKAAYPKKKS